MANLFVTTLGFVICLGLVGGVFVYFVKSALNSEDSSRIDPLPAHETTTGSPEIK
ncbi:hypothetical protein [Mesobacillus harenae]|uniref:hypothetical protein n=1 Tax=Mesobacillus harenae TaxID=2213203 RepID=UPI00157FF181|nr:hypothetical protein [Mesobacillus harenae]